MGCGHRASSERVEHIEQRLVGLDADVTGRWAAFALAVESDARCPGQGVGEARLLLRPLRRRLQHLSAVPGRGRAGHGRRVRRPRPAAQADGERGQERGGPPRGAGLPGLQLYRRANAQAAHAPQLPIAAPDHQTILCCSAAFRQSKCCSASSLRAPHAELLAKFWGCWRRCPMSLYALMRGRGERAF